MGNKTKYLNVIQKKQDLVKLNCKIGLELGAADAGFSSFFLENGSFEKFYSVDKWKTEEDDNALYLQAENCLKKYGDRSILLDFTSLKTIQRFENDYFDFIYFSKYFDDEDNVFTQILDCWSKLKPGGFLGGYEYNNNNYYRIIELIHEFIKEKNLSLYTTREKDEVRSWYVFKPFVFADKEQAVSEQTVVVIGNGPSPQGKGLGKKIDSFDKVVRFNFFNVKEHEIDVGSKTSILFTTRDHLAGGKPDGRLFYPWERVIHHSWAFENSEFLPGLKKQYPNYELISSTDIDFVKSTFINIPCDTDYQNYSTGIIAICLLLKQHKQVSILGFDWWKEKKHHLADSLFRGYNHDPGIEYYWLKRRIDEGYIVDLNPDSVLNHNQFTPNTPYLNPNSSAKWRQDLSKGIQPDWKADQYEWEKIHLPHELERQILNRHYWDDKKFEDRWNTIFSYFNLISDYFHKNARIVELGCGPRTALEWFHLPLEQKHYADPLLNQYRQNEDMKRFWQDYPTSKFHSFAAERAIVQLKGKTDFVLFWDALDQCYDWSKAIENCINYLAPGGLLLVGTRLSPIQLGKIGFEKADELKSLISKELEILKEADQASFPGCLDYVILARRKKQDVKYIDAIKLREDLANLNCYTGIELGVAAGNFSNILLEKGTFEKFYSIDRWAGDRGHDDAQYQLACQKLKKYGDKSVVIKSTFQDAAGQFEDGYFDFIYIDGYAHNGWDNGETLETWWSKLKPGGFFGGYGYSDGFPLTVKFVNAFVEKYQLELYCTQEEKEYCSWYVFKPFNFANDEQELSNETVVVIGNGPSIKGKKLGSTIDSYDVVVRFNSFYLDGLEADLGTKTTILYTILDHIQNGKPDGRLSYPWKRVIHHSWHFEKSKAINTLKKYFPKLEQTTQEQVNAVKQSFIAMPLITHHFSTGLIAISQLLKIYKQVHIVGFDWWENLKQHHLGDDNDRGCWHDPGSEFYWIMRRIDEGHIVDLNSTSVFQRQQFKPAGKLLNYSHNAKWRKDLEQGIQPEWSADKYEWENIHLPYELEQQEKDSFNWNNESFVSRWNRLFSYFNLKPDDFYENSRLVDLGCGPRTALEWFNVSLEQKHYIDPLLKKYLENNEIKTFWQDYPVSKFHPFPAERPIAQINGKTDFVLFWDALDQCYDWRKALENALSYLDADGLLLLGTNLGSTQLGKIGLDKPDELKSMLEKKLDILVEANQDSFEGCLDYAILGRNKSYPVKFLYDIQYREDLAKLNCKIGVELGVAAGYFSNALLEKGSFDKFYSIDRWAGDRKHDDEQYKQVCNKLKKYGDRSVVIKSTFQDAVEQFEDAYFDFIYIDGYAHTGQNNGETLESWWPKLKPGGFFGGHDYCDAFPLTVKFVNAFVKKYHLNLYSTREEQGYRSWYVFKPFIFTDRKQSVSDETIVVIGNGPSPQGKGLGKKIDSFDKVVRFNDFVIDGFEKDIGNKCSILFTRQYELNKTQKLYNWENVVLFSWNYEQSDYYEKLQQQCPVASIVSREEINILKASFTGIPGGDKYNNYSTGLIAISSLLGKYSKIFILGFDWWKELQHHLTDSFYRKNSHDPRSEYYWFKRRIDEGVIEDLTPGTSLKLNKFKPETKNLDPDESAEWRKLLEKGIQPKWKNNEYEWENIHLPHELERQILNRHYWDDEKFENRWNRIFSYFDLTPECFHKNARIVDIGCGPHTALEWFHLPLEQKHYVDPLLNQYRQNEDMKRFWQDYPPSKFHPFAAERTIVQLKGKTDFVLFWDALDQCYDWHKAIKNCINYLTHGGLLLIGTHLCTTQLGKIGFKKPDELKNLISKDLEILKEADQSSFPGCLEYVILARRKNFLG